jgi:hypothetical protein
MTMAAAFATVSMAMAAEGMRQVRIGRVKPGAPIPHDLLDPEGRSRWDLRAALTGSQVRTLQPGASAEDPEVTLSDDLEAGRASRITYTDPAGGDAARRWLFPDRFKEMLRPGSRQTLVVDELRGGEEGRGTGDRLRIDLETVGIGWADLPAGPREVVLQRALILREPAGRRGFSPDALLHRFVDPLAGVVAEISGPVSGDGRRRESVADAYLVEEVLAGAATLTIKFSELYSPVFSDISYFRDQGAGTTIASLTPTPGITTAGDLIALNSWDFSGNTSGTEVAATTTPVTAAETCNAARCGYSVPGAELERTDKSFDVPASLVKTNDVVEVETRASDTVIWLRGGAQNEGVSGGFGNAGGESRFCYTTFGGVTRTPVPLWVFAHQDAPGAERYMQGGDSWTSTAFNCEQNLFNEACGGGGSFSILYSKACGTHTGTQSGGMIKGGVVTVPSGHTFNALLGKVVTDFCVYLTSSCSSLFKTADVRTVNYLWQVPNLGTVARIQSDQNVPDLTSFTTLAETNMAFGLFPPRSITVTGTTGTSLSLSWDPGLDTHRIGGYKIYWDTDSGGATPYAFNSQANPGQVSIAGTSATITGLAPGTSYFVTVTSLSSYTDPSTAAAATYESLLYPTQVSGDPSFVYPVEVLGATTGGTCIPTAEVHNLQVSHDGAGIRICWDPVSDPCLAGYDVLGATAPQSAANYAPIADAGLATCWSGNPASTYFLVVARGTGGSGPWGQFGQ